jgi:hypothetical protein
MDVIVKLVAHTNKILRLPNLLSSHPLSGVAMACATKVAVTIQVI